MLVEYAEPLRAFRNLTTIPFAISEDFSFKVRVETRNATNNTRRLLIWNESIFNEGESREPKDSLFSNNAEYDSRRNLEVFFRWGAGIRWGVNLNQVKIYELRRESPYVRP